MLTVSRLEYLNVCGLEVAELLLVGAVDLEEVFEAFALRLTLKAVLLAFVSTIALRFGGILVFYVL
jgi:hypothetical protein